MLKSITFLVKTSKNGLDLVRFASQALPQLSSVSLKKKACTKHLSKYLILGFIYLPTYIGGSR